jgi:hypothetical protein
MGFETAPGFDIVHKAAIADYVRTGPREQTSPMQRRLKSSLAGCAVLVLALPAGLLPAAAHAAQGQATEAFYRCRDAKGQSHVAQNIPEPCMGLDVEVLDDRGRVIRTMPGQASMEDAAARKAAAEAAAQAAKNAAQRDQTLLATYLSIEDIERLRDQRLDLLEQQAQVTHQYIKNLRERETRLMADVQRFRPYSENENAPVLPLQLSEEIVSTVNGLQVYEQQLAKNTAEQARLKAEFGADIARFKELKGL